MTRRGKVCQNERLKCNIYGSYTLALILNIRRVALLCADLTESCINASEFLTLKQPTSHGPYSKIQSMLGSGLKEVLPLHSWFFVIHFLAKLCKLWLLSALTQALVFPFLVPLLYVLLLSVFIPLTLLSSFEYPAFFYYREN